MEFLPRTLLYYMLTHAYLFWHVYRLLGRKRRVLAWIALPLFVAMGLFPFVYHLLPSEQMQYLFGRLGIVWLPIAFFFLVVFLLTDVLAIAMFCVRKVCPSVSFNRRYLLLLLVVTAILYGYGVYEAHHLTVTRIELATDKPIQQPLRIVFLSDMHIGPQTGSPMLRRTIDAVIEQQPDVILIGGDLFDDSLQGTEEDISELARLKAPLGVYAILGNHDAFGDHRHAEKTVEKAGSMALLFDRVAYTGPLAIAGVTDPLVAAQRETGPGVSALLAGIPREKFTILLDHRPGIRPETVGDFDIQLSGHSHGGQIFLLKYPLEWSYGTPTGMSVHDGPKGKSRLFVSTGTGFSKLPIRLLVPPEIVVIDVSPVTQAE